MSPHQSILAGMFVGLGVVLPLGFHLLHLGGSVFLPMHIPVILAGFILGAKYGTAVGVLTPVISHIVCGMPPLSPPILPIMMFELGISGLAAGCFHRMSNKVVAPLIGTIIVGRVGAGCGAYIATVLFGFKIPVVPYIVGAFMQGIPGYVLQLALIPLLMKSWEKYKHLRLANGS